MATEMGRMQIFERAAAEGFPALPEQPGGIRVPVLDGGEDTWRSWLAIASHEDVMTASAALSNLQQQRWAREDDARRREPPDEALAAEHAAEARRAYEEFARERPARIETLLERIANALEKGRP